MTVNFQGTATTVAMMHTLQDRHRKQNPNSTPSCPVQYYGGKLNKAATDSFIPSAKAKPNNAPVRFGMLGDTEAEKEEKRAKEAYDDARHNKASASVIARLKAEWKEAEKQAEISKKVKNGVMWVGGIAGAGAGAAWAAHPVDGAMAGTAVGLPAGHYIADAQHTVRSPEFKKGYNEVRKSGETFCIVM